LGWFSVYAVRAGATVRPIRSAARTFFEADAVAVGEPPNRPELQPLAMFNEQTVLGLFKRHV
jgi:hypothetical protein